MLMLNEGCLGLLSVSGNAASALFHMDKDTHCCSALHAGEDKDYYKCLASSQLQNREQNYIHIYILVLSNDIQNKSFVHIIYVCVPCIFIKSI